MQKVRLDVLLVERGLVESRTLAQRLVMAGQVRVDDQVVIKPATKVTTDAVLILYQGPEYVSRGGEKLAAALEYFEIDVNGLVCADVGASTGGFTDCLLQNGAIKVYAIDVGQGILHWKLRNDPRVVVMEKTNARYVENLPEPVGLITVDASFISLKILLPVIKRWFQIEETPPVVRTDKEYPGFGQVIALIKPQFEAGRRVVSRGAGVVRSPEVHRQVLLDVLYFAQQLGYQVRGLHQSPLYGPKGNIEFLGWLGYPKNGSEDIERLVESVTASEVQPEPSENADRPAG